jgi:hypothetical protein
MHAKCRRNMGASHAASGIVPLPRHRIASTPPIASHTNGVIRRMCHAARNSNHRERRGVSG